MWPFDTPPPPPPPPGADVARGAPLPDADASADAMRRQLDTIAREALEPAYARMREMGTTEAQISAARARYAQFYQLVEAARQREHAGQGAGDIYAQIGRGIWEFYDSLGDTLEPSTWSIVQNIPGRAFEETSELLDEAGINRDFLVGLLSNIKETADDLSHPTRNLKWVALGVGVVVGVAALGYAGWQLFKFNTAKRALSGGGRPLLSGNFRGGGLAASGYPVGKKYRRKALRGSRDYNMEVE